MTEKDKKKKTKKTFKTSWGVEYTLTINEDAVESKEPTIDDLVEKPKQEKLKSKK